MSLLPHFLASAAACVLVFGEPSSINYFAWSLEVEVQFYILAPILTGAFFSIRSPTARRAVMATALIAIGAVRCLCPIPATSRLYWTLANHIEWFLIGFVLIELYVVVWLQRPRATHRWDLLSAVAWPALFFVAGRPAGFAASGVVMALAPWIILLAYTAAFRERVDPKVTASVCFIGQLLHRLPVSAWS